ncbi:N-acetylmuramoyl-L-alanine amidase CwlD [Desulfuribacillus stibiiarsenatis]|uniref:N-acetylmuramoyl-L-alanine amidase CwlD n=1 Tax=Desulfuribacillus stibiiarsenatis TaxID=1390249 RepID=A0A1E5L8L2_9FIRM|nr:N-acetylmuramoyl-L-alanine amidase CwlD [Desulfuribacillus stibiiarsenatis]OEH86364.1 N-acetylmuramoyl-L-alanine amidase CwlD [Desulfuribacillus stibiiarsenatis]
MERLRRKVKGLFIYSLVFILVYVMLPGFQETKETLGLPLSGKVIAIDAGHGGPDGGAISQSGIIEKDITLEIAQKVRDYLQQAGAAVIMTREGDYDLAKENTKGLSRRKVEDLRTRVKMINESKAELLVSVHLNSIPSERWSGAQSFYPIGSEKSKLLAERIQGYLIEVTGKTERVPLPDKRIYLIREVKVPAVVIEVGFLSNPEEAQLMTTQDYQTRLAHSIYLGIIEYIAEQPQ